MSEHRETLARKILHTTMTAFAAKGIRAVKMDDIAAEMQISKRTLYEIFSNKEEMLMEGVKMYTDETYEKMKAYAATGVSVMDILLYAFRMKVEEIRVTNPVFYSDLRKYPVLLAYFDQRHKEHRSLMVGFMERGAEEGFFLKGLNYEFVAFMIDATNRLVMDAELYRKYSMQTVFLNHVYVSLRGLCTEKGIKEIDKFLNDFQSDSYLNGIAKGQ